MGTTFEAIGIHVFAGLFSKGVEQAGANIVAMLEDGEFGTATHAINFPGVPIHKDPKTWPVAALRERGVDLVYSNSACAGFSLANAARGLGNDTNNGLKASCETALALRPRAYVVESVPNLFKQGDPMVSQWERAWQAEGYYTTRLLENAVHIGVPQKRQRALFIAARYPLDFSYPEHLAPRTVREAIGDLADMPLTIEHQPYTGKVVSEYQRQMRDGSPTLSWHVAGNMTRGVASMLPYLKQGQRFDSLSDEIYAKTYWVSRDRPLKPHGKPSLLYRRLDWNQPSVVLTGSVMWFHPDHNRLITVREKARLMGVPDSFQFDRPARRLGITDAYNEAGKAVSPMVGRWVVSQLMKLSVAAQVTHRPFVDLSKTKEPAPVQPERQAIPVT